MLIEMSSVFTKPNGKVDFSETSNLDTVNFNGEDYKLAKPANVDIAINIVGNRKAIVELNTEVSLSIPCDKCLSEVEYAFPIEYSREIDFNEGSKDRINNMDELNYIDGTQVDTDRLITDEIILDFPLQVLCKEDCKGLCRKCGCDLNKSKCDCDQSVTDIRMSVISDIFKNFKEV